MYNVSRRLISNSQGIRLIRWQVNITGWCVGFNTTMSIHAHMDTCEMILSYIIFLFVCNIFYCFVPHHIGYLLKFRHAKNLHEAWRKQEETRLYYYYVLVAPSCTHASTHSYTCAHYWFVLVGSIVPFAFSLCCIQIIKCNSIGMFIKYYMILTKWK